MQVQSTTQINRVNSPVSKPVAGVLDSADSKVKPTIAPPSALNHVAAAATTQPQASSVSQASFSEKDLKMELGKGKRPGSKKQIPTILGLLILFVALISGVLLFGQGTGVFAPRATAETTPKNIRISNVTDKTFTISFYTDESTIAFVKYGEESDALNKQASDDRDQLSGVVKDYHLHHITLRGLSPSKNYFYVLGTGSSSFDNEGQPYSLSTAAKPSQSPSNSQTIYGNVLESDSSPAEGAVVYIYSEGMGALSSLVKSSGSWGISLSNAFNTEKSSYLTLTDESVIDIKAQGVELAMLNSLQTTVGSAQPVADLILSKVGDAGVSPSSASDSASTSKDFPLVDKDELLAGIDTSGSATFSESTSSSDASSSSNQSSSESSVLLAESDSTKLMESSAAAAPAASEPEVLNLSTLDETKEASATTITTTQPVIKAILPANTMIRVVIHSDTAIDETVQTDANGEMVLDVASLGQNLEPGEHTASYTYIDPVSGKEVTKTYNFTVDPKASRQLAAVITPKATATPALTISPIKSLTPVPSIPYGSGNPYSPTISAKPTLAISSSSATSSSGISTRSAAVSTTSGQYNSGSVGTTIALLLGGLFFVSAGVWSYLLATSFEVKNDS